MDQEKADVLVICAHPDDAELSCGGTIAALTAKGKKVVVVDCTRGEMGTRGTPEERIAEAEAAGSILGVWKRINLAMPDCGIQVNDDSIKQIITLIRRFRPQIIITHPPFERHTDHEQLHKLVREANFKSGLAKIETFHNEQPQERWRIRKIFCFMQSYEFPQKPDFYIDISDYYEKKMESLKAYRTQIYFPGESSGEGLSTRLYRPDFLKEKEARAIYFGSLVGVRYAEAFMTVEPLLINDFAGLL